jgi:hypothetical protein
MNLLAYIIVIAVSIGIFFLLRGVLCWYWKINQGIRLLTEISEKLDRLISGPVQRRYAKAPKPENLD